MEKMLNEYLQFTSCYLFRKNNFKLELINQVLKKYMLKHFI